ncbi:MAG: thioredoxin family protein, partial [Bacteroidales bacterium]
MKGIMMKVKTILILLFAFFGMHVSAQIDFLEISQEEEWNVALEDAKESEKLIFLDIYATWCGPCKYLDKNVYTDVSLGEYYNANYINIKMDGETPFGSTIARKYGLTAYPTMFYLNSDQEIITQIVGVREADPLTKIGEVISENQARFDYFNDNYKNGELNAGELKEYQELLRAVEQGDKAAEVAGKIIPTLSHDEILSSEYKSLIVNSSSDLDSEIFKVVNENREIIDSTWTPQEIDLFYAGVFNTTLFRAIESMDEVLLGRIIDDFLPAYMGEESTDLKQGEFITKKLYFA